MTAAAAVDLARVQFATTSIYHFLFVPLTLGLGPLVAIMQTVWYRTGNEAWLRLTRFFGTLLLINIAIAVATGLVQEFEFGLNRLSPRIHLATIWIVVLGSWASGYFILVANSWMQHPVGYKLVNGEAQLTSVWALLSNNFALRAFVHTMLAGVIFGS